MKYKISFITYIDVLGFKNIVASSKPQRVHNILRYMKKGLSGSGELSKIIERRILNFSDTIIRSTNVLSKTNKKQRIGLFYNELCDIIYFQADMIINGVFLRGGITIDYLYHKSSIIFGPGLIEAHRLESQQAIYPRVIIDNSVFAVHKQTNLLSGAMHDFETDISYISNLICKDKKGVFFVDYLRAIDTICPIGTICGEGNDYIKFIFDHRQQIINAYTKNKGKRKITAKYRWLASYHNWVVSGLNEKFFLYYGMKKSKALVPKRISGKYIDQFSII